MLSGLPKLGPPMQSASLVEPDLTHRNKIDPTWAWVAAGEDAPAT